MPYLLVYRKLNKAMAPVAPAVAPRRPRAALPAAPVAPATAPAAAPVTPAARARAAVASVERARRPGAARQEPLPPPPGEPMATREPALRTEAAFSQRELATLPKKARQSHHIHDWESMLHSAVGANENYNRIMRETAQHFGHRWIEGHDPTSAELKAPGGVANPGPLKTRERAMAKVESDYKGKIHHLKDVVRGSFAVHDPGEIPAIIDHLRTHHGVKFAQQPKNRFAKPTPEGYMDLNTSMVIPDGEGKRHVVEGQFHQTDMLEAKGRMHDNYAHMQRYERKVHDGGTLTPEEHAHLGELKAEQRREYGAAAERMYARMGKRGRMKKAMRKAQDAPAPAGGQYYDVDDVVMWVEGDPWDFHGKMMSYRRGAWSSPDVGDRTKLIRDGMKISREEAMEQIADFERD